MIDVVTVGAGGGSIAWLSPEGTLKVGPRSAGADPGPMCYPDGGSEPTVTDAHVVLGRIPPHLLGGEIPLSAEAAREGLGRLGGTLGLDLERTATGILEISAWNQANALRQVTVARGLDVRDFTLTTFGGSGSLLACRLMDVLGLPRTLVPPDPGNLSAFGLLTVDVRNDHVQTAISRHADLDRSEEHTSELQSRQYLVCRLLLSKQQTAASSPDASPRRARRHPLRRGGQSAPRAVPPRTHPRGLRPHACGHQIEHVSTLRAYGD